MDAILRGVAIYFFLLVIFRVAGRRTLSELSSFDFVLMLVVGESTQQALLSEDYSVTNACLLIITLVGIDILLAWVKQRSGAVERWLDGVPLVVLADGQPLHDRMKKARIDDFDILDAARKLRGLERFDQIKYAVLERNGGITIIPYSADATR